MESHWGCQNHDLRSNATGRKNYDQTPICGFRETIKIAPIRSVHRNERSPQWTPESTYKARTPPWGQIKIFFKSKSWSLLLIRCYLSKYLPSELSVVYHIGTFEDTFFAWFSLVLICEVPVYFTRLPYRPYQECMQVNAKVYNHNCQSGMQQILEHTINFQNLDRCYSFSLETLLLNTWSQTKQIKNWILPSRSMHH